MGIVRWHPLEIYRRVDETTKNYPWSVPSTEEQWHSHAEGVLMVALTTLNLPTEAWKSARLLRAVPNCCLVLMLAYHMLSPALSVEETGLMAYLRTPPEAGPSIAQVTSGLQNWKCAGRRLVPSGRSTSILKCRSQLQQRYWNSKVYEWIARMNLLRTKRPISTPRSSREAM